MDEKSWRTWKSDQKIVMDEELVQNVVMDDTFVKNFAMGANIDPKVVMDLSVFQIGARNVPQSSTTSRGNNYRNARGVEFFRININLS